MLIKILVADDSASDRLIIKNMLSDYSVLTACDGIEALRVLAENDEINLLILDLNMPNMNGLQVLESLSHLPGLAYKCKYDHDWTMQYVSKGCYDLTGYKSESLLNNGGQSGSGQNAYGHWAGAQGPRASQILCKRSKAVRIEQIISGEQLRFQGLLPCGHINGKAAACQGSSVQSGILSA